MPVSRAAARASLNITSSVTSCTEAARSMCFCVSNSSGLRAGPPNKPAKRALVMVRPVQ